MTSHDGPVLLAYDGSPNSANASAVGGQPLYVRRALVCHVWSGLSRAIFHGQPAELPGALADAAEDLDETDRSIARRVAVAGVELATAAGFEAEPLPVCEERKTWRTLLEAGDEHQASMIVAGAHGKSGFARAVLGSVSTGLVHHACIPVLVVPATTTDESTDGPLLLCYDGSDEAKQAIAAVSALFESRNGLVLHLWESWVAEAPALAGVSKSVIGMATELDEVADEQSSERTTEGVELAELDGLEVTGISERATGPIWMSVLATADEHSCAAIAVGSRGMTGIAAALGSVSNGVVHHSRRPVLVVPPEEPR
jgi:nucleotide-binding universal stress UspA family protein